MATGTSFALPLPMPMRPSPSPTTASAAKPRMRPPFTTLVTRLMLIIFSRRPSPVSCCCMRCCIRAIGVRFLKLEAVLARRARDRLHASVFSVAGTVESNGLDAERLRLFGDGLAAHCGRRLVTAVFQVLADVGLQARRARQHLVAR